MLLRKVHGGVEAPLRSACACWLCVYKAGSSGLRRWMPSELYKTSAEQTDFLQFMYLWNCFFSKVVKLYYYLP